MAKKEGEGKQKLRQDAPHCPEFKPSAWDEKEIAWKGKLFVKTKIPAIFNKTINKKRILKKINAKIEAAGAKPQTPMIFIDKASPFFANIYVEVTKPVQGLNDVKLTANFLSKVFEGKSKNMKIWLKDMEKFVKTKGKESKKNYFFYPYCKECSKKYGKNYMVILTEI